MPDECPTSKPRLAFYVGSILAVATLLLYWPAGRFDFIIVDDHVYVFQNAAVIKGLSWSGIKWAFSTMAAANWHPVTWLSHMLDCSVYGLFAGGHHLTNVFFHTANTVLLFLVLKRLTGALWPSALAAALFAWHPLHVESVAWICERKDVFSGFFLLLTIWAYAGYVARRTRGRYLLALTLFLLGLMAKPMLVTLPCLLLLLDYWPLNRFEPGVPAVKKWLELFVEKIPFFFLSLLGSVMTMVAQSSGGAIRSADQVPLLLRATNALCSYSLYLAKAVWPVKLAVFYPLPATPSFELAAGSLLLIAGVSYAAYRWRARFPWLIVGWLWFLGTLVPVIGLVQVGSQSMADRYTYLPYIGLFIMLAWSLDHWLRQRRSLRMVALPACVLLLVGLAVTARVQLGYWRDSVQLFQHAVLVTAKNKFCDHNLSFSLIMAHQAVDPLPRYETTLSPTPHDAKARYYRSFDEATYGRLDSAVTELSETLNYNPRSEVLHNALGIVLSQQEKLDDALEQFRQAIDLNAKSPWPYFNCAVVLQEKGNAGEALTCYAKALELRPAWPEALDKLAFLLATCPDARCHNPDKAIQLALKANELTSSASPLYLRTLAVAYAAAGSFTNAVSTGEMAREKAHLAGFETMATNLLKEVTLNRAGKAAAMDWRSPPARLVLSEKQ
jgi:protein O-mannosyl-transferase